jgi:hypothetical protein
MRKIWIAKTDEENEKIEEDLFKKKRKKKEKDYIRENKHLKRHISWQIMTTDGLNNEEKFRYLIKFLETFIPGVFP